MNNILIERTLVEFLVGWMSTQDIAPNTDEYKALEGLKWTLTNQPSAEQGLRQKSPDPRRTDVGMGALLNSNSDFI